mgnify:CR=1 FL=1
MPGGDGTGPAGMGPMTGRAAGYCAGYQAPGYMNPVPGRGFGFGRGRGAGFGRGMGFGFRRPRAGYWNAPYGVPAPYYGGTTYTAQYSAPAPEQEADMLKSQAEYFENALGEIKKRIGELKAQNSRKED